MKISVIVPVYNRLEHLRALCRCLINQSEAPYELIISDDGSSQKVSDYIEDLLPLMNFKVKHIYQKDLGFRKARALNNAVREAEGDLLVFCDQDLIFSEKHIENIKNQMKERIFLMGRPISVTEEEKNVIYKLLEGEKDYKRIIEAISKEYILANKKLVKKDKIRRILNFFKLNKRGIRLVGMSYALHKKDYIAINGYDENYMGWGLEDDDFGNRLYILGVKGKEFYEKTIQLHLYHPFDPTKRKSLNEDYYYKRKKEIFKRKEYFCRYGYNNPLMKDTVIMNVLKER